MLRSISALLEHNTYGRTSCARSYVRLGRCESVLEFGGVFVAFYSRYIAAKPGLGKNMVSTMVRGLRDDAALPNPSALMLRYFFHVMDGQYFPDTEGTLCESRQAMREQAISTAGALLKEAAHKLPSDQEWQMHVTDENNKTVLRLRFSAEQPE
jgi:hypothetical protein